MKNHLKNFLAQLRVVQGYSELTITSYKKDLTQFVEIAEIKKLEDITKNQIIFFLGELIKGVPDQNGKNIISCSASTRRRKLSAIRSFCAYLLEEGLIEHNYALDVRTPKEPKRLPKAMSQDQVTEIIESPTRAKDKAIFETLYGVGCRISELVNIKISDINLATKQIRIFGKGGKERIVPINKSSLDAILEHISTRKVDSPFVFEGRYEGTHMNPRSARERVENFSGGSAHPHMFRHSYATHLLDNGADVRHIQKLMGHENISTTMLYTKVSDNSMTNAYRMAHPRG